MRCSPSVSWKNRADRRLYTYSVQCLLASPFLVLCRWYPSAMVPRPQDMRRSFSLASRAESHVWQVVESGQCVLVDKVFDEDGVRYLRLADGRGWVFDSDGTNDLMAKLEDLEVGASWCPLAWLCVGAHASCPCSGGRVLEMAGGGREREGCCESEQTR